MPSPSNLLLFPPLLLTLAAAIEEPLPDAGTPVAVQPDALPLLEVDGSVASEPDEMRAYTDRILGSKATFDMVPVPGGTFLMGSPSDEDDRHPAEGPQRRVTIEPFWMGAHEVTWDAYHVFMLKKDLSKRPADPAKLAPQDRLADAVSRPTPPYVPMDFNMGVEGYPAIAMTQFAAKQYTKWLTMKTGRFHRLPTEAEWEYACRAGTTTRWSFGDDPSKLDDHAWHYENSDDGYHPVGTRKANPWGLYDMHGNVAEWVLDAYTAGGYGAVEEADEPLKGPVAWPRAEYPRCVRGGSWDDDPEDLRSAARRGSKSSWKQIDPQIPKSIWYHTDVRTVGFRVVRPLTPPPREEWARYWEADLEHIAEIEARQRDGER